MNRDEELATVTDPATASWLRRAAPAGTCVLDVGCGPAQYRRSVGGRYIGLDITAAEYRPGLARDPDVVADAYRLPFGRAVFDLVFFAHTFYHFADASRALDEARRTLRPGGLVAIFDYSRPTLVRLAESYARSGQGAVAVVRSCADWIRLLSQHGWRDPDIGSSSLSPIVAMGRRYLPSPLYRAWIDGGERAIVVTARAP